MHTYRPTEEEVAAALAAVTSYLSQSAAPDEPHDGNWGWAASSLLVAQGFQPARLPLRPTWGNVERLRRAGRGGSGIVGA
jgi:hypothetical protein